MKINDCPSQEAVCRSVQCIVIFILMKKCLINVAVFSLCFPLNGAGLKELPVKFEIFKIKNYSSYWLCTVRDMFWLRTCIYQIMLIKLRYNVSHKWKKTCTFMICLTHFSNNSVRAKLLQLSSTLCNPMDSNLPGSSVHGVLQARILAWVTISSSRGST